MSDTPRTGGNRPSASVAHYQYMYGRGFYLRLLVDAHRKLHRQAGAAWSLDQAQLDVDKIAIAQVLLLADQGNGSSRGA